MIIILEECIREEKKTLFVIDWEKCKSDREMSKIYIDGRKVREKEKHDENYIEKSLNSFLYAFISIKTFSTI